MSQRRKAGVFALEGDWQEDHRIKGGIRPLLQMLEEQAGIPTIHRDVGTPGELVHYAKKWTHSRYKPFSLLMLAFHGTPGALEVGDEQITLEALSDLLGDLCRGRVVHFGSCATLRASEQRLRDFKRKTGATYVTGYTKYVDWLQSASFELLMVDYLTWYARPATAERHLRNHMSGLIDRLGWVLV